MREATKKDKLQVINILSRAFEDNRSVNYVVRQGRGRQKRIRRLIAYSFNICHEFGQIYITPDEQGCAMILFPEKKKTNLKTILWDLQVAFFSFGIKGAKKAIAREKVIHEKYPSNTSIIYLWFIGVSPEMQRNGIGGTMMKRLMELSQIKNRPIYLETSNENNVSFYEKYGLNIYYQHDFDYLLYFMKN